MIKANFHIHTTGSDGTLTPEQAVRQAIDYGITDLCFTDHCGVPRHIRNWGQARFEPSYVREVRRLTEEYKDKINLYFGAEFDWTIGYQDWTEQEIKREKYDFILGSVHVVPVLPYDKEKFVPIGWNGDFWNEVLAKYSNVDDYVKEYYKQVRLMVKSGLFDCVAHLDVVRANNHDDKYFSEDTNWYEQEVLDSLDVIANSGMAMEINSSGLTRYQSQEMFSRAWILEEAKRKNIPITIGTDGHREIANGLDEAYDFARKAGYKSMLIFKDRKPIEVAI